MTTTMTTTMTRAEWAAEKIQIGGLIQRKLCKIGKSHLKIQWSFNTSFTRRMGDAKPDLDRSGGRLRFSTPLWPVASEAERTETVLHELAHILDFAENGRRYNYGRRGRRTVERHGASFKRILISLGGTGDRTHNVNRDHVKRKQARWSFPCPGCQTPISFGKAMRTRWITRGQIRQCRCCKTSLGPDLARRAAWA